MCRPRPKTEKSLELLRPYPARAYHEDAALPAYADALDTGLTVLRGADRLVDGWTLVEVRVDLLALAEIERHLQLLVLLSTRTRLSVTRPC